MYRTLLLPGLILVSSVAGANHAAVQGISRIPLVSNGSEDLSSPTSSPWQRQHKVSVRLISAASAIGGIDRVTLGLHFKMEPGWRIYWRNPVGSSYPPSLDTSASKNLKTSRMKWPVPTRIPVYGQLTLGYEEEVVLPIDVVLKMPNEPLNFRAQLQYLACGSEICVPSDADLELTLPRGSPGNTAEKRLVDLFSARVPKEGPASGISIDAAIAYDAKETDLIVVARSDVPFKQPDLVVGAPDAFEISKLSVHTSDGGKTAIFKVPIAMINEFERERLPGTELVLIVSDVRRVVTNRLTVTATRGPASIVQRALGVLRNLLPPKSKVPNE